MPRERGGGHAIAPCTDAGGEADCLMRFQSPSTTSIKIQTPSLSGWLALFRMTLEHEGPDIEANGCDLPQKPTAIAS